MIVVDRVVGVGRRWRAAIVVSTVFALAVATVLGLLADSTPVDHGWFPMAVIAVAAVGTGAGLLGRSPRWLATRGAMAAVASAAVVALGVWYVSGLHLGHYPPSFLAWAWGGVLAVALAACGLRSGPAVLRTVRVLSAPVALFASFLLINSHYGYWPTLGTLLQRPAVGQVSAGSIADELRMPAAPTLPANLETDLRQTPGRYGPVAIPGDAVNFRAAQSWVWLPPDFATADHRSMPVLLMLPGWPGEVQDWMVAGQALSVANQWSATHGGAAPIMVFVDENGATGHDTECVNGPQGQAGSYLSETVPAWIHRTLGVDDVPARWATVGFSEGGTCALDLALEHPDIWGRFVDISGDLGPNYGTTAHQTLVSLFGGSTADDVAHQPLTMLAQHHYPTTNGWLTAGRADVGHASVVAKLAPACQAAGIHTTDIIGNGGHSWIYAGHALAGIYPNLMGQLGTPTAATSTPGGAPVSASPVAPTAKHPTKGHTAPKSVSPSLSRSPSATSDSAGHSA